MNMKSYWLSMVARAFLRKSCALGFSNPNRWASLRSHQELHVRRDKLNPTIHTQIELLIPRRLCEARWRDNKRRNIKRLAIQASLKKRKKNPFLLICFSQSASFSQYQSAVGLRIQINHKHASIKSLIEGGSELHGKSCLSDATLEIDKRYNCCHCNLP